MKPLSVNVSVDTGEPVEECMGVIDKYLQKEMDKEQQELAESTLEEQLVFLGSMRNISPPRVRHFGLNPSIISTGKARGLFETDRKGNVNPVFRRIRMLESELQAGQSVYRIVDGKVQKVTVVGVNGDKARVAPDEPGSDVEEQDSRELGEVNPDESK